MLNVCIECEEKYDEEKQSVACPHEIIDGEFWK